MILSSTLAWTVSIGITALCYLLFLSFTFSRIQAKRHLQERWSQFGEVISAKWDKVEIKIDKRNLQAVTKQSKLKEFLSHPYPSIKALEHLFYRSGVFPKIKLHISLQIVLMIVATEQIYFILDYHLILSFFIGLIISITIHLLYLRIQENAWKKSFLKTFPFALDMITRGLKSGMTLGRGIAVVAEEIEEPVGSEFNYIASQLQIGVPPSEALNEAADRIGIDEFRFFALALIIQGEMGGSLADILGKLSELVRERDHFRQKVHTLSSESRVTAIIVGSLPIFLGITVEFISPGYMKFFFVDPKGKIMLWICLGLSMTGAFTINRMMSVKS